MACIITSLLFCIGLLSLLDAVQGLKNLGYCRPEDGFQQCSKKVSCDWRHELFWTEKSCIEGRPTCNNEEFLCRRNPRCNLRKYLNTKEGCYGSNKENIILPCRPTEFTCAKSRNCLPRQDVHNNENDCSTYEKIDYSDEQGDALVCRRTEFQCQESGRCIPREWVMDGQIDCENVSSGIKGSDEDNPLPNCFVEEEYRCKTNGRCLRRYRVKDGFNDCADGSDETQAFPSCVNETEYRCRSNGRCIPRSWMKDGTNNCVDGSDENVAENYNCTKDEFRCHNGKRCISNIYKCDGMDHCGDCSDEIEACESPGMLRCPGDPLKTCIPFSFSCDALVDCPRSNTDNPGYLPGFKCKSVALLRVSHCYVPQWRLNDEISMCSDESDICFVDGKFVCTKCMDGSLMISKKQLCDGVIDCRDLSDECICGSQKRGVENLCNQVCYAPNPKCGSCNPGQIRCTNEDKCIDKTQICDGVVDCSKSGIDEIYCSKTYETSQLRTGRGDFRCQKLDSRVLRFLGRAKLLDSFKLYVEYFENATRCDGVLECPRFEDECNAGCETEMQECKTVQLNNVTFLERYGVPRIPVRTCNDFREDYCCDYIGYLLPFSLCNGVKECPDGEDELVCPPNRTRFECDGGKVDWINGKKDVISIDMQKRCNLESDCLNSTDELECPETTHFYCHNEEPIFVSSESVRDGKQDCTDNSDECSKFAFKKENDPFSTPTEMIGIGFLRYLVWIMATFAILGNLGVIIETYLSEIRTKSPQTSNISKCNRYFMINLAGSDFIMGIALLMIGIQSTNLSGQYCNLEKKWRTSGLCSFIGVLTVLSSQTSVSTLVIITLYRMYSIYRPFKASRVSVKKAIMFLILTWICSAILALIPLIPVINQTMVTHVFTEPSIHFKTTTVSWDDMRTFAVRIFSLNMSKFPTDQFTTWGITVNQLEKTFPSHTPRIFGYFGFYSAHGVCLPRLFRTKNSHGLHPLSLFIIALNFFILLLIIVCYVLMYYKTFVKGKRIGNQEIKEKRSQQMQKKITILIATDLCCWLPICFMTFVSESGIPLSPEGYAIAAIVLLPINSCLNPIIYSNGFQYIRKQIKIISLFRGVLVNVRSESSGSSVIGVTPKAPLPATLLPAVEMEEMQ